MTFEEKKDSFKNVATDADGFNVYRSWHLSSMYDAGYAAGKERAAEICDNLKGDYANTGLATNYDCAEAIRRDGE